MESKTAAHPKFDTSVWIDFLTGRETPAVEHFRERLEAREAFALTELIYLEVLQGVREPDVAKKVSACLLAQLFLIPAAVCSPAMPRRSFTGAAGSPASP